MKLNNNQLQNFVNRIKLRQENMPKYRDQIDNLKQKLEYKIKNDKRTGIKVTKFLIAGSWKKRTILRPTGEKPIDLDLVLYIEGDENLKDELKKLHDFVVEYLEEIYPTKDINRDVDAEGNTKSIKIKFTGTGLEVDIVPVIPLSTPKEYVWQPQRGGGGKKHVTSVTKQLDFAKDKRDKNPSFTAITRAIKWWKNYKELDPSDSDYGFSSFSIELILSYLDEKEGIESDIETGIIRFFRFVSDPNFPVISFSSAINKTHSNFDTPIYISDPTNNENNAAKKVNDDVWKEVINEAINAFETLLIAQSRNGEGNTIQEWKDVFGPSFNITKEE